jgi:hypothetical protein
MLHQIGDAPRAWKKSADSLKMQAEFHGRVPVSWLVFAAFFVLLKVEMTYLGIGIGSFILFILYVLGMRLVFRQEDMQRR